MSRVSSVILEAQKLVIPSPAEEARIGKLARVLLARTKKFAARFPETRGVLVGGSFAKGTWLPGHVDLDIFVRFDPSTPEPEFEKTGLAIGAMATKGYPAGKKFAQHPYTEAILEGTRVNIVPCFAVKQGEWKSAADRSPFHVLLVQGLPETTKTQIRLLKQFMNTIGVYGAEIEKRGFSGYVAEVLVMKMGSLQRVAEWFAEEAAPKEGAQFTLADPVDKARDLGVAVSGESLGRMVLASREFLRRPGLAFFRRMSGRARPSIKKKVIAVAFSHKALSEDTLWGELRKTTRHLVRHVEMHGFAIARSMAASNNKDRSAILLIPEFSSLPELEQRVGPTVDRRKDVEAFVATNAKDSRLVWVDGEARVRLLRPRTYTLLTDLLTAVARGREGRIGASREIELGMKSAAVLEGARLLRAASSAEWMRAGIREITSDAIGTR
ncbi:MAG: CCA tRNA nucleotidyltransferase [Nitrososphaerota archaeon]|nr:CCA tRNA nucleotidyltransferase [Nitrososphaerota archaeon]MDG7023641.1 CCA tRNA nucleotidyltransferase [Nitrososphaerota archaeon]